MSKSYTYDEVKNEFKKRGYELLDTQYNNCKEKLLCLDQQGYKLLISFDKLQNRNIQGSRFHPSNPYTIENINNYAKLNGLTSKCISEVYTNSKKSNLEFICECGKSFMTSWDSFSSGHKIICDDCSGNPFANKDYDSVKSTLLKFGFILDVEKYEYLGVTITPLICYDQNGYKYKIEYDSLLKGKTPRAVGKSSKFSIYNINIFLKNNNKDFTCVSEKFIDRDHLLEFVCNRCGESVFTKWKNVNRNDDNRSMISCPNCDGRIESMHALVLKQMFKHYYPDTIEEDTSCINPITNCILPTDIVNHKLKIAIEVQSEWHDKEYQKVKDKIKKDFWINKGYDFYDPDIRDYSILEMCQLFFDIDELPEYINYNYSNKLNIKVVQEMLDNNIPPNDIAKQLNYNVHRIYDAIYAGKIHYSDTYIRQDYTPVVKLDNNNTLLDSYVSIQEAARCNNIDADILATKLRKKQHEYKGYIWHYKSEYDLF